MTSTLATLIFFGLAAVVWCGHSSPRSIANFAKSQKSSTKWSFSASYSSSSYSSSRYSNKCAIFVADVLRARNADVPTTSNNAPIPAEEWANPRSPTLRRDPCWNRCPSGPREGDVIAEDDHVGIVTGYKRTTSASTERYPIGKVIEDDWGFRRGQRPTCWRYEYTIRSC